MEPVTALTALSISQGAAGVVRVLGDVKTLREFVQSVTGRETRVEVRLAALAGLLANLDRKADEQLDQRYVVAMGVGVRAFGDAVSAEDQDFAHQELLTARDRFREAAAAARSSLEAAHAERYLMLSYLVLGQVEAAHNAWKRLNTASSTALRDAAQHHRDRIRLADARTARAKALGGRTAANDGNEAAAVVKEAADMAGLAVRYLREAAAAAVVFGLPPAPRLSAVESWSDWPREGLLGALVEDSSDIAHRWRVEPAHPGVVTVGVTSVEWRRLAATPVEGDPAPSFLTRVFGYTGPKCDVDIEVRVRFQAPLSRATAVTLAITRVERMDADCFDNRWVRRTLDPGTSEHDLTARFRLRSAPADVHEHCKVVIDDQLMFAPHRSAVSGADG
ncbi:MAG: hypothetical protein HOV94_09060 [Saccharothrix sp.]|nr:hypothetical protein [Saccharothrix sp.]